MPMAEPIHPSGQRPSGTPPNLRNNTERELPEHATPSRIGHIPGSPEPMNPRLRNAAETVGGTLGSAVASVRQLPDKLREAKSRFTVIKGRGRQGVREVAEEAIDRVRDAGYDVKQEAGMKLEEARRHAAEYVHQNPLQVIGAAAAFGMLVGIGLRVWRDHAS